MMTDSTRSSIILGLAFLGILLMNGLFFMMPYEALNPYEYLSGSNLSTFQVLDIFIGGAIVPLVALATGYLINAFRHYGIGNLAKVAAFVLALGIVQTFFIFAFDFLPGLVLMALVALLFLKAHWAVSLLAALLLFFFHLTANVLVGFFASVGSPTDIIYTAMQDVQEFTSVFRSTDYFAIIALNIELFSRNVISTLYGLLFTVLPWLLVGMSLGRLDIVRFIRSNPVMHIILFIVLAGGGMAIKMIQVLTLGSYSGRLLAENFGGPVLALGYFLLMMYLTTIVPSSVLEVFRRMGRYFLTLYILSNVVFMMIFYGIGAGMYGEMEIAAMIWTVLIILVFLMVLATVMHRYRIRSIEDLFTHNSENGINR
ncbi:hypothetical protein SN16_02390 [Salinicoccus roseus]|uniref:DUF418 domain-containing protein n=1 Tax=Salinicoccus roseus TaxID=45670 RepID=A0A0C2DNH2_9STAP|nr:hypothetical protein SN16_02390 [Salinicoccus roseus]RPE54912.1 uncharacterized protein EDC33_1176 [Salinicoccus roseus]